MKACWLKEAKSGNKDLRQAYFFNADLKNIDLSKANLTEAQIVSSNLTGANLSGANLTRANLSGTNFTGANFKRTNLTNASLSSTNLTNADFTDANFTGANFLNGAKIGGAKLDLTVLRCRVTTTGGDLNREHLNGEVYGTIKNGTIVYKDGLNNWGSNRISITERRGDRLVDVGLVDGKFVTCAKKISKTKTKSK